MRTRGIHQAQNHGRCRRPSCHGRPNFRPVSEEELRDAITDIYIEELLGIEEEPDLLDAERESSDQALLFDPTDLEAPPSLWKLIAPMPGKPRRGDSTEETLRGP